jgi:histidyl-tRNA synthetase
MNDVLPPESGRWRHVEQAARSVLEGYGFEEVRTPVAEYTALFSRSIGEVTDIVEKEMYTFTDRDGRSLSLRPEGTASAVRAFVEHSVGARDPLTRWYYVGPMFRHERPQRGRYRQFWQIGAEALGVAEPAIDAEMVAMLYDLMVDRLHIAGVELVLNCLGGPEDRPAFRAALVAYFQPRAAELCGDCQRRITTNVLRVVDCKVPGCAAIAAGAPSVMDHLGAASKAHFDVLCSLLKELEIPVRVDPKMVRGLDYYTGPVFELRTTAGELGSQNAVGGGGRYDLLVESLGGTKTAAVGFALGLERLALALPGTAEDHRLRPDLYFVAADDAARRRALGLARQLRSHGLRIEVDPRSVSFKAQMKRADRRGALRVGVLGERELAAHVVSVKTLATGEQHEVPERQLAAHLAQAAQ